MSVNANRNHSTLCHGPGRHLACLLAAALLLGAFPVAAAPAPGDGGVLFTYIAPDARTVHLAGDFNGWDATALPLIKGDDGVWSVTVALPPGEHEYKFVVDDQWLEDPDNPRRRSDPFGGYNSVVTIQDDGTPETALAAKVEAPKSAGAEPTTDLGKISVGRPRATADGILFTYRDPGAGAVFLAGSFNGWNATDTPLKNDGQGNWAVAKKLDAGSYEYKFVVDGNWVADPENPDTSADPYGGVNSLVTVDAKGKVVAAASAPTSVESVVTTLATKMTMSGRYLTRFEMAKNIQQDPRYRLLRPSQSVDLNFNTQVNDLVNAYTRLRMDSNENVILNNITGNLDEASLFVHPDKFSIDAYWNREIFTSGDPMNLVGNIDYEATIGNDHLPLGKGTAGALVEADPFGVHFQGFFANVHNYDYYNDPKLFDNTGGDRIWVRFSRKLGNLELGTPIWLQRELIWMNFESIVGQPSTGIPALDDHLARTGDSSTWFETESHDYKYGLDATLPLHDGTMSLGAEVLYVDYLDRFVTGNQSGQNNVNGAIDVPFNERDAVMASLRWDYDPDVDTSVRLQHTYRDMDGATPEQRVLGLSFQDQATAENHIFFSIEDSPAQTTYNWTELEASSTSGDRDLKLYIYHRGLKEDFGSAGRTVPGDSTRTDHTIDTWYLSGMIGQGTPKSRFGHGELEFGLTFRDPDVRDQDYKSYEFIGRWQRSVSPSVNAIADVRYIKYDVNAVDPVNGELVTGDKGYWSPFVGLQYRPQRDLELVLGYGVDPVEFSIDYNGRQFGRWWYRQRYLFDHPGAGLLDAEQYLADARVFTLRAQMTF